MTIRPYKADDSVCRVMEQSSSKPLITSLQQAWPRCEAAEDTKTIFNGAMPDAIASGEYSHGSYEPLGVKW